MINVEYTLEFSQCSQGLLEWKVVDVSGLLLSVSSLSFSVSLSLSWVPSVSTPFSSLLNIFYSLIHNFIIFAPHSWIPSSTVLIFPLLFYSLHHHFNIFPQFYCFPSSMLLILPPQFYYFPSSSSSSSSASSLWLFSSFSSFLMF